MTSRKVRSLKLLTKVEAAALTIGDDDGNSMVFCKVQKHFRGIPDYWSNLNHFGCDYHSDGDHFDDHSEMKKIKIDFNQFTSTQNLRITC